MLADFAPSPYLPHEEEVSERLQRILDDDSQTQGRASMQDRLMLMMSRSCELRCSYCFVAVTERGAGTDHSGRADESAGRDRVLPPVGDMSLTIAKRSIDWLMRSSKPRLGLQFFGGEPTRRWPELLSALKYAVNHPGRDGRPLEVLLTTNGLGMTAERLRQLSEYPVMIQLSIDGDPRGNRYRKARDLSIDAREALVEERLDTLIAGPVPFFMSATIVPAGAKDVFRQYLWARKRGIPALQLTCCTGVSWSQEQIDAFLVGQQQAMAHHAQFPKGFRLFNWNNGADPAPLCGDIIVDVDGSVFQAGAIFHEKRSPELRRTYRQGHISDNLPFTGTRFALHDLFERTHLALAETKPRQWEVFVQNVRFGAAITLVVDHMNRKFPPELRR